MAKITIIRALKKLWNAATELLAGKQDKLRAGSNIIINDNTISAIIDAGFRIEIVQSVPSRGLANTIYFVPVTGGTSPNVYDEYMFINGAIEKIGSTEIDLSNYYNKTQVDNLLAGKQGTLTAGANINITNNTIKAEGYVYNPTTGAFVEGDRDIVDSGTTYQKSTATGRMAHAEGCKTTASTVYSHTEGLNTSVTAGGCGHAEGNGSKVQGGASHAEGQETIASGYYCHSEGYKSKAQGNSSHAEGNTTTASGDAAHAEGMSTKAVYYYAHAEGVNTQAQSAASHAEGSATKAVGDCAHTEGYNTETGGNYTSNTKTAGASVGAGAYSHAEGNATIANGIASHSEGKQTLAKGNNSHAEGSVTIANGTNSHAEGGSTVANGGNTHVEGRYTQTHQNAEHAQGSYNKSHTDDTADGFGTNGSRTIHSIGIGTADNARKNAVEVMQNGDAYLLGVGNYDGIHIKGQSGAPTGLQTLQEVVNGLRTDLENGLKECQKTVYPYARFDEVTGEVTGDYPDGGEYYNEDVSYFEVNYIGAYSGNGGRVVCVRPWRITELITNDNLGVPIELLLVDPMYNSVDEWYANREYIIRVVCDGADGNLSVPSSIRWATPQIHRDLADQLGISIDDYAYMPPLLDGRTYDIHILNGVAWWVETPKA